MDDRMQQAISLVHVRYEGRSWDVPAVELGISPHASDGEVRAAVARFLEVPVAKLGSYVIERYANGNITLRPQAVFG